MLREYWMDNLGPEVYNKRKLKDFWADGEVYLVTNSHSLNRDFLILKMLQDPWISKDLCAHGRYAHRW